MPYASLNKSSCKAWGNIASDGTVNNSFNIQSVEKNSTGNFTITFEYAFSDANYCSTISAINTDGSLVSEVIESQTDENVTVQFRGGSVNILGILVAPAAAIDPDIGFSILCH